MNLFEVAQRTGVTLADLELLLRGVAADGVAQRLVVPLLSLEQFLTHGYASAKLAHRLGTSMAAAEALGAALGPEGRIGIILGLLVSSRQGRAAEAGGR